MLPLFLFTLSISLSLATDCSLERDKGNSCDQPQKHMYYYDSRYKVCQPFQYAGCGGNANIFESAEECKNQCVNGGAAKQSSTTEKGQPNSDSSINNFVPKGNSHDQWRKATECGSNYLIPDGKYVTCPPTCPENHTCTNGVCCPSKDFVCSQRDDTGTFQEGVTDKPRFGWSHQVNSCVRFSYYGARGNYNNFPNFYSCLNYCKDSKKIQ